MRRKCHSNGTPAKKRANKSFQHICMCWNTCLVHICGRGGALHCWFCLNALPVGLFMSCRANDVENDLFRTSRKVVAAGRFIEEANAARIKCKETSSAWFCMQTYKVPLFGASWLFTWNLYLPLHFIKFILKPNIPIYTVVVRNKMRKQLFLLLR